MSEAPVPRSKRPGVVEFAIMALLLSVVTVKAVRWWLAVSEGTTTIEAMTIWGWVKVGFYHVAVVAGVAGIIGMLRARARPDSAEPGAPADRGA